MTLNFDHASLRCYIISQDSAHFSCHKNAFEQSDGTNVMTFDVGINAPLHASSSSTVEMKVYITDGNGNPCYDLTEVLPVDELTKTVTLNIQACFEQSGEHSN